MRKSFISFVVMVAVSSQAVAGTAMLPQPYQLGEETARFEQGVPVVTLEQKNGAVQITPLPMDHGSVAFSIVVYNDGTAPANFDVSDIEADVAGTKVAAQTADKLESSARSRAMWSQIGVALLAGVAAVAVANAHTTDTYRSRLRTPHGTYSWVSSYRDNSIGTLGAVAAVGGGVAGVVSIQQRLDATLAAIGDQVVQRTTVDPAESYGGRIVLDKIKVKGDPRDIQLSVNWAGEVYRFGLHLPKNGESYKGSVRAAAAPSRDARSVAIEQPAAPAAPIVPVATPEPQTPGSPTRAPLAVLSTTNT